MNLAFVGWLTFNTQTGGIETLGTRLAQSLISRGHRVCFAAVSEVHPSVEGIDNLMFPTESHVNNKANEEALVTYFSQHNVSVIVCHNSHRNSLGKLMRNVADRVGAKLVFSLHFTPDDYKHKNQYPGVLQPFVRLFWRQKLRRVWRRLYRYCDAFVVLIEDYIPMLADIAGIKDRSKFVAIPNLNSYTDIDYIPQAKKEDIVLFVGRLGIEKGLHDIISVWREVAPLHPTWKLQIVGDGEIKRELQETRLPNMEILGRQDPRKYYEHAKIQLQPSAYEGWCLVNTEAMQHSVVPIVYDSYRAARVVLDDGDAGILVPYRDQKSLARELSALMSDDERRTELSQKAYRHVQSYNADKVAPMWERLFASLLKR